MSVTIAYTILYILIFIIGSCVGSFLNVLIYRVPKGESFIKGRSHCPGCGKTLNFYNMIPVLSWFILKGKCKNCEYKISVRYPLVEAMGGVSALVCVLKLGFSLKAVVAFFVMSILIAISFVDWDTMEIPNGFLLWLILPCVVSLFIFEDVLWYQRIIGFFVVSLPMFLIIIFVDGAFGGADIKLMSVCGFLLGWQNTLVATFLGLLGGGIYCVYLLASKKGGLKTHFSFGPFLSIGIMIAMLWGEELVQLYLGMFLL
ncbi:MAG: prepilin peptidase [Clostridia bacterium]|nr:prepilin peptidase [Clostridia bacterium]